MKSTYADRSRRLLAKLRELQVEGVEVLQEGPTIEARDGHGAVQPITPVPAAVLINELRMDDDLAADWFAPTFNALEKRGLVQHLRMPPDRASPIAYRRRAGEIVTIDLDAGRLTVHPKWPADGPPLYRWATIDSWTIGSWVKITDAGLAQLTPPEPVGAALTPKQVAQVLGVDLDKVYSMIRAGTLPATNVGRSAAGGKARWMVARRDLEAFMSGRTNKPVPRANHRRRTLPPVRDYFPD